MSTNQVVRWTLGDAVNPTNVEISAQVEAGIQGLLAKSCTEVGGVCVDYSGNIYVSDAAEHVIYKIAEGGLISTLAGEAGTSGNNGSLMNVPCIDARFNTPKGLACDKSNNIYVADSGNNQVRIIRNATEVGVLAGTGVAGLTDGTYNDVEFDNPSDVAVDNSGTVYVADTGNEAVRRIRDGATITFVGNGVAGDAENGVYVYSSGANIAALDAPSAVAVDPEGSVYICDAGNYKIKKVTTGGRIYLHSGSGVQGHSLGTAGNQAYTCEYDSLKYCDIDRSGNLYVIDAETVIDTVGTKLIKVDYDGVPAVIADFDGTFGDNSVGVAVSPNQTLFVTMAGEAADSYSESSESTSSSSSSSSSTDSSASTSSSSSSSSSSYSRSESSQ